MIEEDRLTHTHAEIGKMEDRFLATLEEKIMPELKDHKEAQSKADEFALDLEVRIAKLKEEFDYDKKEPTMLST